MTHPLDLNISPQRNGQAQGLFRMPADAYHKSEGVSQSVLKKLHRESPAHCREYMTHPPKSSDAQKVGTALHSLALDGDQTWCVKPEGMKFTTKDGIAWRDAQTAPILTHYEHVDVVGMKESLMRHPSAGALLSLPGESEVSAFCLTPPNTPQAMRKCRPDRICRDEDGNLWVLDLKTTSCGEGVPQSASEDGFSFAASKFGYHWQAAYYCDLLRDIGVAVEGMVFIVVESTAPYCVGCYRLDQDAFGAGQFLWREALARYLDCLDKNDWPGYPERVQFIGLRRWADGMGEVK